MIQNIQTEPPFPQNSLNFQTFSALAALWIILPIAGAQETIGSHQANQMRQLKIVYSTTALVAQTAALFAAHHVPNEFLLKKQRSQHAKQRAPGEGRLFMIPEANTSFFAHVASTVLRHVQDIPMDSLAT